jgi:hypothetical protein
MRVTILLFGLLLCAPTSAGMIDETAEKQEGKFIRWRYTGAFTLFTEQWHTAMRQSGICGLVLLGDGSGIKAMLPNPDCQNTKDSNVVSWEEIRRMFQEESP